MPRKMLHDHKCCEMVFIPVNIKTSIIDGEYVMMNKSGVQKKWIPKRFFKNILEPYEGREIVITIRIQDLGDIDETE